MNPNTKRKVKRGGFIYIILTGMLLVGFLILITIAKPSRKLLIWIDLVGLIGLFLVSIVIYFDRKSKKGLREILKNKFKYSKEYKRKRRSPTHTEIQERLR